MGVLLNCIRKINMLISKAVSNIHVKVTIEKK